MKGVNMSMLKYDNITIELNYETLAEAMSNRKPILIDDESDKSACVELSLDQARFIRDNFDYVIKKFER